MLPFIPLRAGAETILVLNSKDAPVSSEQIKAIHQFRYELCVALERQKVVSVSPSPDEFFSLLEPEQIEAAENIRARKKAYAAVWLYIANNQIAGIGMVVASPIGTLARIVQFDTPMSAPQDIALIAKELLQHSTTYADPKVAEKDNWIPLKTLPPGARRVIPSDSNDTPDEDNTKIETKTVLQPPPPKIPEVEIALNFSQGIVSYVGQATHVGGELSGSISMLERLHFKIGLGAEAGPFLQQGQNTGWSIFPLFGVGVSFPLKKTRIDLWGDAAATFSRIFLETKHYSWWAFTGRLGFSAAVPRKAPVAFVFRAAMSTEYPEMKIEAEDGSDAAVFKSPLLSVESSVGIRISLNKLGATRSNRTEAIHE